jgi:hypothetical protein
MVAGRDGVNPHCRTIEIRYRSSEVIWRQGLQDSFDLALAGAVEYPRSAHSIRVRSVALSI